MRHKERARKSKSVPASWQYARVVFGSRNGEAVTARVEGGYVTLSYRMAPSGVWREVKLEPKLARKLARGMIRQSMAVERGVRP